MLLDMNDILKQSYSLGTAIILSILVFLTYKIIYDTDNYKKKFNILLVILIFITAIIISLIKSSLMTSLGLLGIISIVRFRVKLKDYRDIGFLLWSITIGIAIGTENYLSGIIYSILISLILLVSNISLKNLKQKNILIIRDKKVKQEKLEKFLVKEGIAFKFVLKNQYDNYEEYIYQLETKKIKKIKEKIITNFEYEFIRFI
ncbi:DUF4956 domain-containing protein [Fusobacterium varium]|uniref:DUF4956 domain-containing protein n=1 Tax=Fusobacterium varium TaxID=856 RepID=UPI00242A43FE|nr:DUF4956 domain-containing protein [Fusobacterium varium]